MPVQKQIPVHRQIQSGALIIVGDNNDRVADTCLDPQLKDEEAQSSSDEEASSSLFSGWKEWSSKYDIIYSRQALKFSKPLINRPTAMSTIFLLNSTVSILLNAVGSDL